ncbi:MAG TPA: hypothetical protein VFM02_00300 [Candidatus Paceibacterota bacterium]|nr:hypothetical protein [Candidatus Paceibacterota bacterium]
MVHDKPKNTTYEEQYFEQYKLYVNSMEKISDRRESVNKQFLALNSAILVLVGLVLKNTSVHQSLFLVGLSLLGMLICIVSWFLLTSYKQLNTGKFKIIHEIEQKLPLQLYKSEWEALGEGKNKKKYFPFSHVERLVPVIFALAYLLIVIFIYINN